MIGVLESFEKITMENWSAVDSASGIVFPNTLSLKKIGLLSSSLCQCD